MIEMVLLGGLFAFYLSLVLLFEEKDNHYGPWPSESQKVVWYKVAQKDGFTEYTQPVTVFDRVRRIFGVYRTARIGDKTQGTYEEVWYINDARMEVWTCPVCLSFWVAILPTAFIVLFSGRAETVVLLLPIAAISVLLHRVSDLMTSVTEFCNRPPQEFIVEIDDGDGQQV